MRWCWWIWWSGFGKRTYAIYIYEHTYTNIQLQLGYQLEGFNYVHIHITHTLSRQEFVKHSATFCTRMVLLLLYCRVYVHTTQRPAKPTHLTTMMGISCQLHELCRSSKLSFSPSLWMEWVDGATGRWVAGLASCCRCQQSEGWMHRVMPEALDMAIRFIGFFHKKICKLPSNKAA